jgi:polyisoprenoid-binding protein YceI
MTFRSLLALLFTAFMSANAHANTVLSHFKAATEESVLSFEVLNDGNVLHGGFKNFDADITFHPEALDESSATVTVDMSSVYTENSNALATLSQKEWFNSDVFPKAVFSVNTFEFIEENRYQATGDLTLKDRKLPVIFYFTLHNFSSSSALITGTTILKRKEFGIGWESVQSVADDVKIIVTLKAVKTENDQN